MGEIHKKQKLLVMELSIPFPFGQLQVLFLVCVLVPVVSLHCPRNCVKCFSHFLLYVIALKERKDPNAECLGNTSGTHSISFLETENHRESGQEGIQECPLSW